MKKLILVLLISTVSLGTLTQSALSQTVKSTIAQEKMTLVNLNTASLEQLVLLPGLGKKKAAAIIEYRTKNGKFKTVDDLINVKGVGKKMLEKLKGRVKVS